MEEERKIQAEGNREIGFSISVDLQETGNRDLYICFQGPETQKTYVVDVRRLKAEKSVFRQRMNLLAWENKDKNLEYIREKGWRVCPLCGNLSAGRCFPGL